MLEEFLSYIDVQLSVNRADKLLLAISGGVDSMVMVDLFYRAQWPIEIAHVNHSTRNGASDQDASFVKQYATDRDIPYHEKKLDYRIMSQGNFQENARNARYEFFRMLCGARSLAYIATAHHQDDRWETFMIHLNRKSGLSGLTSLDGRSGDIIRPLLQFTKSQIETYAKDNQLAWREDSSNSESNYLRNKVRNQVTPTIKEIFPNIIENANASIRHLTESKNLITDLVAHLELIRPVAEKSYVEVDIERIRSFRSSSQLLYTVTSTFGYTLADITDMLRSTQTGATYYSSTHETLYDRGRLLIRAKCDPLRIDEVLSQGSLYHLPDGRSIQYGNHHKQSDITIPTHKERSTITVRSVRDGDKYKPEHLKGKTKTLKKYMNDRKMNRYDREEQLVVEADGEIIRVL